MVVIILKLTSSSNASWHALLEELLPAHPIKSSGAKGASTNSSFITKHFATAESDWNTALLAHGEYDFSLSLNANPSYSLSKTMRGWSFSWSNIDTLDIEECEKRRK
uniref:Uncharacterized protein n=1 Tax=Spumella elongata TaxID=89044 RepID=A0A7S3MFR9_9STRA